MVCGNFILPEPASYVFFYVFSICATYCTLSTTKGLSDSSQALTYTEPKKSE
ncbi:MAG: phage holin [[Clostridium] leptum]